MTNIQPRNQDGNRLRQRLARKGTMRIGTWNTRSMANKTTEIPAEIKICNLDIVVISENKKKGQGSEVLSGYLHFWSGVNKSQTAQAGASILVKLNLKQFITDYSYVSERCMTLTMKMYGHETQIIAVYAPTEGSNIQIKDSFYEEISSILSKTKKHTDIILAGDINAKLKCETGNKVVGKFAEGEYNDSGERIVELCNQYQLKIANTFFQHKEIHRYTWERPSMNQKSILDYIIVKQLSLSKVYDCRVKRGANCGTDHHLVVATIVYSYEHSPRSLVTSDHSDNERHLRK